jgi:hypothetical protein
MSIKTKTVDVEDSPRWQRLLDWLADSYGGRLVAIRRAGEPVAYLAGPEFAGLIVKLAKTWQDREPPFTQAALDRWQKEVFADADLADLLAEDAARTLPACPRDARDISPLPPPAGV